MDCIAFYHMNAQYQHYLVLYENLNLTYTTEEGSRVSCLAQAFSAAFGKGMQLISGSPYAETERLSWLA